MKKIRADHRAVQLFFDFRTKFRLGSRRAFLCNLRPTFVFLCLYSSLSFANVDLSLGTFVRSYPLSGVAELEAGYGILLRGEANSPFSSYARLKISGESAAVYNSLSGALEFFPLGIAGIRAGGEAIQNDTRYSAFDCDQYQCTGRYYRIYIEGEMTLGAGPIFVQGRWRRERWTQGSNEGRDFIDPTSAVVVKGRGDSQTVYYGVAGLKMDEQWTLLGVLRYSQNDQLEGWSRFPYGVIQWKSGEVTLGVGAGVFESSLKEKGLAAVGLFRWEIRPSLALR